MLFSVRNIAVFVGEGVIDRIIRNLVGQIMRKMLADLLKIWPLSGKISVD